MRSRRRYVFPSPLLYLTFPAHPLSTQTFLWCGAVVDVGVSGLLVLVLRKRLGRSSINLSNATDRKLQSLSRLAVLGCSITTCAAVAGAVAALAIPEDLLYSSVPVRRVFFSLLFRQTDAHNSYCSDSSLSGTSSPRSTPSLSSPPSPLAKSSAREAPRTARRAQTRASAPQFPSTSSLSTPVATHTRPNTRSPRPSSVPPLATSPVLAPTTPRSRQCRSSCRCRCRRSLRSSRRSRAASLTRA